MYVHVGQMKGRFSSGKNSSLILLSGGTLVPSVAQFGWYDSCGFGNSSGVSVGQTKLWHMFCERSFPGMKL